MTLHQYSRTRNARLLYVEVVEQHTNFDRGSALVVALAAHHAVGDATRAPLGALHGRHRRRRWLLGMGSGAEFARRLRDSQR